MDWEKHYKKADKLNMKLIKDSLYALKENDRLKEELKLQVKLTARGLLKRLDLKQQIEKMKCCKNCNKANDCRMFVGSDTHCTRWELAE